MNMLLNQGLFCYALFLINSISERDQLSLRTIISLKHKELTYDSLSN